MYFITCFDENWLENCRFFHGLAKVPRDKDGQALYKKGSKRCFGYYPDKESALAAVSANVCNIQEYCYSVCVVEYLASGIHALSGKVDQTWFRWTVPADEASQSDGQWLKISRPAETQQIVNFALG